ncbi:electron transfer flavoprotein subunit beta/FixA family protein [Paenibacillus marinisediminis]
MNIYVLLKQTFDTEEKIVIRDGQITDDGVKYVINPYDEYAVEEALLQRDQHGGTITVVSIGPDRAAEALRTALAMGADEAVLISDDRLNGDEYGIAKALAAYFSKQSYDLIIGGNFSVDTGGGQVAVRVSQLLGIPHASSITKLEIADSRAVVLRDAEGDSETLSVALPALFTAQQGLNEPRYPSLPGIMKAKKKPFHQLSLDDLGLSESDISAKTERISLSLPPERKAGQILKGELSQQAAELVNLLRTEAKLI